MIAGSYARLLSRPHHVPRKKSARWYCVPMGVLSTSLRGPLTLYICPAKSRIYQMALGGSLMGRYVDPFTLARVSELENKNNHLDLIITELVVGLEEALVMVETCCHPSPGTRRLWGLIERAKGEG